MPRPRPATPRLNVQVEMPVTLVAALDLLASRANKGAGITRSHLVRAVLSEYVELKLGPDLRRAIVTWDKHGGDLLATFMRQQLQGKIPEDEIGVDPMESRNYNADPLNNADALHQLAEEHASQRKESPQFTEKGGVKAGEPFISVADGLTSEFAIQNDLQAPEVTESEFISQDPERKFAPLPEHFPLKRDGFNAF